MSLLDKTSFIMQAVCLQVIHNISDCIDQKQKIDYIAQVQQMLTYGVH